MSTEEPQIPKTVKGKLSNNRQCEFERGRFLGKGGFAKCYEMTPLLKGVSTVYAGKIMPKSLMQKEQQREKMKLEIHLHRQLEQHKNVVQFESVFEDENFVYIILELCKSKSMMELHKRRKAVTEPEARFFTQQILEGLVHLHSKSIVHRDLKLGNLFLDENLVVKIGDFGLATTVKENERKQTICGTPNYIAPEVLMKKGHAFEVDVWAVGCILYTLLVGKPPFETQTLKETYNRIKNNQYTIPSGMNVYASKLIRKLLSPLAHNRPTAREVLSDPFFSSGVMPRHLPASCLTMTPRFDRRSTIHPVQQPSRPALTELRDQAHSQQQQQQRKEIMYHEGVNHKEYVTSLINALRDIEANYKFNKPGSHKTAPQSFSLDIESPKLTPFYWVSKWVDYSDKYGISYQLCDGSAGVLFNDHSRIVMYADSETVQYIDSTNVENFYTVDVFPPHCNKKMTLLKYFKTYMNENLVQTGAQVQQPESDVFSRVPYLFKWSRHQTAIVFLLSNGVVQMNFFECHSKLVFCPIMQAVTLIDPDKVFHTFRFQDLNERGYPYKFNRLLKSAEKMMSTLLRDIITPSAAGVIR